MHRDFSSEGPREVDSLVPPILVVVTGAAPQSAVPLVAPLRFHAIPVSAVECPSALSGHTRTFNSHAANEKITRIRDCSSSDIPGEEHDSMFASHTVSVLRCTSAPLPTLSSIERLALRSSRMARSKDSRMAGLGSKGLLDRLPAPTIRSGAKLSDKGAELMDNTTKSCACGNSGQLQPKGIADHPNSRAPYKHSPNDVSIRQPLANAVTRVVEQDKRMYSVERLCLGGRVAAVPHRGGRIDRLLTDLEKSAKYLTAHRLDGSIHNRASVPRRLSRPPFQPTSQHSILFV